MTDPAQGSVQPEPVDSSALEGGAVKRRRKLPGRATVAALCSALLLVGAFPPFGLWPLGYLAVIPLYCALSAGAGPIAAFRIAWLFGFVLFLAGAYWMLMLGEPPWGILAWAMLAAIEALPFGLQALIFALAAPRLGPVARSVLFASIWVAGEWMRGWGRLAFPWFLLAASQTHAPMPMLRILAVTGQWGLSFALLLFAGWAGEGMIALQARRRTSGIRLLCGAFAVSILLFLFGIACESDPLARTVEGAPARAGKTLQVATIQANITKEAIEDSPNESYVQIANEGYFGLTRTAAASLERPELIIWPETVVPGYLLEDPELFQGVSQLARSTATPLLVGTVDKDPVRRRLTNTAVLFDSAGKPVGRYDKLQIVPIGEYFPLRGLLGPIYRHYGVPDDDLAPGDLPGVLSVPRRAAVPGLPTDSVRVGVLICYDDVFPTQARDRVRQDASVLTLMTSDETFGTSAGPQQHADLDVLRAIESGRYLVRAAATGPSEVVSPDGAIQTLLPLDHKGILTYSVPLRYGETLFVRWGDWFAWLSLGIACALTAVGAARRGTSQ